MTATPAIQGTAPPPVPEDKTLEGLADVNQVYVKQVFDELETMDVALDPNPLELGPRRLREKIAKVRAMRSRCENIFLQVSRDLYNYSRYHRLVSTELDIKLTQLIAEDIEVRAGRNAAQQQAIASLREKKLVAEVERLKSCLGDMTAVMIVVKAKRADLSDIQGRIKDQMRLCQDEITYLGGRWGSRRPPEAEDTPLKPGHGAAIKNPSDLDDLLDTVEGEMHLRPDYTEDDDDAESETDTGVLDEEDEESDPESDPMKVPADYGGTVKVGKDLIPDGAPDPELKVVAVEPAVEPAVETDEVDEGALDDLVEEPAAAGPEETSAAKTDDPKAPKPAKALSKKGEPPAADVILPGTATEDDVEAFLSGKVASDRVSIDDDFDLDTLLNSF